MKKNKKNLTILFFMIAAFALVISCDYKAPTQIKKEESFSFSAPQATEIIIGPGETLVSAYLRIYTTIPNPTVRDGMRTDYKVYMITKDTNPGGWEELTINWRRFAANMEFGGLSSPFVIPESAGWITVRMTNIVQAWIDGSDNFGILIKQNPRFWDYSTFSSKEGDYAPTLVINLNRRTVRLTPTDDAYISEQKPTFLFGAELPYIESLVSGFLNWPTYDKYALLKFKIDVEEDGDGCSLTPGYWKTHSEKGPAPYDATWALLLPDGEDTPFFSSGKFYYEALWTQPKGNAYWILARAYIAAELNQLNGADFTAAQTAYDAAKLLFLANTPADVKKLKGAAKQEWTKLATILDNYNNGYIGPGHCD